MNREPTMVWDQIDIDLLVRVAQLSILSPAFAVWVPITFYSQGYDTTTTPFRLSLIYFDLVIFFALLSYSSKVWRNQLWRFGLKGLLGGRRTNWEDQIIVVTGGSSGLGRLIAETLAVRHVTVVVLDVKPYVSDWNDVTSYVCDVSDRRAVFETAEKIRAEVGDPTVVVNNAGLVIGKSILDLDESEIRRTVDVNALASYWTVQAFLPAMIRQKTGHVVTIASLLGNIGLARLSDYCASKHALMGFHESLAYELKHIHHTPDIRTTLVCPGRIATEMFAKAKPLSPLNAFFLPTLSPHVVAKAVIAAIDLHESQEIYLPFYTKLIWAQRGVPSWARDLIAGSDEAMSNFHDPSALDKKKT